MKQGRQFWAKLAAEYDRGGATVAEVAARHGVRAGTLSWWRWRLGRDGKPHRRRRRSMKKPAEMQLVPVELAVVADHVEPAPALDVVVGDVVVRVPIGADAAYVARLVRELRGC